MAYSMQHVGIFHPYSRSIAIRGVGGRHDHLEKHFFGQTCLLSAYPMIQHLSYLSQTCQIGVRHAIGRIRRFVKVSPVRSKITACLWMPRPCHRKIFMFRPSLRSTIFAIALLKDFFLLKLHE